MIDHACIEKALTQIGVLAFTHKDGYDVKMNNIRSVLNSLVAAATPPAMPEDQRLGLKLTVDEILGDIEGAVPSVPDPDYLGQLITITLEDFMRGIIASTLEANAMESNTVSKPKIEPVSMDDDDLAVKLAVGDILNLFPAMDDAVTRKVKAIIENFLRDRVMKILEIDKVASSGTIDDDFNLDALTKFALMAAGGGHAAMKMYLRGIVDGVREQVPAPPSFEQLDAEEAKSETALYKAAADASGQHLDVTLQQVEKLESEIEDLKFDLRESEKEKEGFEASLRRAQQEIYDLKGTLEAERREARGFDR